MSKQFASAGDMAEKRISFTEIGPGLWAFTAEGDHIQHRAASLGPFLTTAMLDGDPQ